LPAGAQGARNSQVGGMSRKRRTARRPERMVRRRVLLLRDSGSYVGSRSKVAGTCKGWRDARRGGASRQRRSQGTAAVPTRARSVAR
jgi:hypothetical protein